MLATTETPTNQSLGPKEFIELIRQMRVGINAEAWLENLEKRWDGYSNFVKIF